MYVALIKVAPAVIGPYVNLGGDGSVLGESFALYPSILSCSPMQSWLLPIYPPILGCPSSRVPKGRGVLVSRDVAMVGVGRRSCPIGDHLRLFSSLLDATQMNNAVPTSPLLQQMGHPHSYPSLGQISNPYEQQPPGKELNKYASLKAVGKCCFVSSLSLLYFSVPSRFPYPLLFFYSFFCLSYLSIYHLSIIHHLSSIIYLSIYYLCIIYLSIHHLSIYLSKSLSISLSLCLILSLSLSHVFWVSLLGTQFTKDQSPSAAFSWPQVKSYLAVWGRVAGGEKENVDTHWIIPIPQPLRHQPSALANPQGTWT